MRWLRLVTRVAPVLAVAALAAPATATTLIRQGLEDLVQNNENVVQGKVLDIHSYWNPDHTFIFTDVRVRPTASVRRNPIARDVTFTVMGGTVGETTVLVIGSPELVPGSEYLLFLNPVDMPGGARMLTVRDLVQGVFEVGVVNGQRRMFSQALGTPLVPDAHGRTDVPGGEQGFEMDDMIRQIRELAGEQ
jgi:hypothetical protein